MSYGWLTESSLIPKPGKAIDVSSTSIANLKDVMYSKSQQTIQQKMRSGSSTSRPTAKVMSREERLMKRSNDGVEKRSRSDVDSISNSETSLSFSERRLKEKAEIYDALLQGEPHNRDGGHDAMDKAHGCLVVDFEKKRRENFRVLPPPSSPSQPPSSSTSSSSSSSSSHQQKESRHGVACEAHNSQTMNNLRCDNEDDEDERRDEEGEATDTAEAEAQRRRDALLTLTVETDKRRDEIFDKKRTARDSLRNRLEALRQEKRVKQKR